MVGNTVRAVSCVVLVEQLNRALKMNILTQHVTQSAGCQQTSSRDVTKCVVISNVEDFVASCQSRHRSHQNLPALMATKIPSNISKQRTAFSYHKPDELIHNKQSQTILV